MRVRILLIALVALTQKGTVVGEEDSPGQRSGQLHQVIDQMIDTALTSKNLTASETCSDAEFVRRIHLDLTGVIPSAKVASEFIESKGKDKRSKLIDRLLNSDRYSRHMATVFDVMLMERRPDKHVTTPQWRDYLATAFAENKPLHGLVSEILGADGVDEQRRPAAKFYLDRAVDRDTLVRDIGRLMLGMNLQCAQCHDHPDIDDYLHQHYHGLSVFVAGSKTFKQPDGKFVLQEVAMREVEFASVFDPETTRKTGPRLIDALIEVPEFAEGEEYVEKPSRSVRSVPKFSLREMLSKRLPSDETPEFARNMANRLWAMLMGRGIVHPLDMHHSANPPSHPPLLDALAKHFASTRYDTRAYLREIALSKAYQRSSLVRDGVDPETLPVDSYAVANMKGLSPEQLFESVLVATGSQAILERQIDEALAEEASADTTESETEEPSQEDIATARQTKRTEHVAQFVSVFDGMPGQPQTDFSASLQQALFLANSKTVSEWVLPQWDNLTERLATLVDAEPDAHESVARELYLSVLSRKPTPDEIDIVKEELDSMDPDQRRPKVAALVWSLIASAEFRLNH